MVSYQTGKASSRSLWLRTLAKGSKLISSKKSALLKFLNDLKVMVVCHLGFCFGSFIDQ